jgi:hypothetical protein
VLRQVLPQVLLARGQLPTLVTLKLMHAFVSFQVLLQLHRRGASLFAAWVQAFEEVWLANSVFLQEVLPQVSWAFEPFTAEDAREGIKSVHVVFVCLQKVAQVRAASDVAFQRLLLQVQNCMLPQCTFCGKTFGAFVAPELLNTSVWLVGVFCEIVATLEKHFAALIEALEDSSRNCVVAGNVKIVILRTFHPLVAGVGQNQGLMLTVVLLRLFRRVNGLFEGKHLFCGVT